MSDNQKPLTHSVDIDLLGVTKVKSMHPEPTDQGVVNGELLMLRFRVKDGEAIAIDTGRREIRVRLNPRPDIDVGEARHEASDLTTDLMTAYMCGRERSNGRERELRAENEQLHRALAFASSVIKSGEPWSEVCEEVIGGALRRLAGGEQ